MLLHHTNTSKQPSWLNRQRNKAGISLQNLKGTDDKALVGFGDTPDSSDQRDLHFALCTLIMNSLQIRIRQVEIQA